MPNNNYLTLLKKILYLLVLLTELIKIDSFILTKYVLKKQIKYNSNNKKAINIFYNLCILKLLYPPVYTEVVNRNITILL